MKKKGTFSVVLSFAGSAKDKLTLSVVLAILSVTAGLFPYIAVYKIINLFFSGTATMSNVVYWALLSAAAYLAQKIFFSFSTKKAHHAAYNILEEIRNRLSEKLMKMPLGSAMNRTAGQWKGTILDKVENIELPLAHMIPEGISNFVLPVFVIGYLFFLDWRIALSSMICVVIGGVVYAFMMRNYGENYDKYMKSSDYVNSVMVEYTEGIEVIKAFNQSSSSYKKYVDAVTDFKKFTLSWFGSTWGLMSLGGAILPSTLLGVLPVGVLLYINGQLSPAELTLAIILSLSIIAPVSWFTTMVNEFKSVQYAVNEVQEILDMQELPQVEHAVDLNGADVELKNVHFAYSEDDEEVIHGVNLKIPAGNFTALVGPSGGGKSTLVKLIARFWDVTEGNITLGSVDIREMPLKQLADNISFVSQDNFLFNCSLFENIRIGKPDATDDEVLAAARAARCEEFIGRLEKGWDTEAGDAGNKLSGGERQRLSIARAILKDAPVVILDEATAFTDPENEDQLQQSISKLTKGKSLLVIAHRLSTIQNADQIVLLEKGKITARGTHEELLENCPLYNSMWQAHIGARSWTAGTHGSQKNEVLQDTAVTQNEFGVHGKEVCENV